jgi:hypothetical protein
MPKKFVDVNPIHYENLTIETAKTLKHGDILLDIHTKKRWRVNGAIKLWKRNPDRFSLPIKHGLYAYDYATNDNCHHFVVMDCYKKD